MPHSLYNCMTRVYNASRSVLFPCSVDVRNVKHFWKTVEVRFVGGIVEGSTVCDRRDIPLSKSESSIKRNENYESRLLKIAIIGVPNVGKSTIINQLVGRKVCSISSKVHTTRCKARAIGIEQNTQLVFLDTPGLVSADESHRHHLEHSFHRDSEAAMLEADVIGVVHDVSNIWTRDRLDSKVLRLLYLYPKKHSFLILNKIDAVKTKRKLLDVVRILTNNSLVGQSGMYEHEPSLVMNNIQSREQQTDRRHSQPLINEINFSSQNLSELQIQRTVQKQKGWPNFSEVFMVSALLGDGVNDIRDYLLHISEPSSWLFPASEFTDQPSETVIVNTVRAKLLDHLPEEIPYNLETVIEYFNVGEEGTMLAVILVICPSYRLQRLIVGRNGQRIRAVAREAQQELQSTFRQQVQLKVSVTDNSHTISAVSKKGRSS